MCLASEAGKMDTVVSQPEDSSSPASLQQTDIKLENKEDSADADCSPPSSHTSAPLPALSSVTSTSTDAIPSQPISQNACVKKKSKKKDVAKSSENDELLCSAKKIIKRCSSSESNVDSVFSTIEAVAKGAWKDTEEKPKKKLPSGHSSGNSGLSKKKIKPKAKTFVKEKEEEMDDGNDQCAQHSPSEVELKEEVTGDSPNTESEEANMGSTDLQGHMAEPLDFPCSLSPAKLKEEDGAKESPTCESSAENRGSRKSERSCKGALYKTLVSEGMLTSLRANIDRGINFNLRVNDLT